MLLAYAMSLVGLNPEEFKVLITKLTPASELRAFSENFARPRSPSARSESSGIGSLTASSMRSSEGSSPWPTLSSPRTPSVRSTDGSLPSLTPPSSRTPSVRSIDGSTPSLTPISSRPVSPTGDPSSDETMIDTTLVEAAKVRRDILNLAANIREPEWQVIKPPITQNDPFSYVGMKIVNRFEEFNLKEDYPMRYCEKCGFGWPSPYLV